MNMYVSTSEAAKYMGVSASWLSKTRVLGGDAPRYVKVGRRVVYRLSDLDEFMENRLQRTTSGPPANARRDG